MVVANGTRRPGSESHCPSVAIMLNRLALERYVNTSMWPRSIRCPNQWYG
jgi:hypothetical protein